MKDKRKIKREEINKKFIKFIEQFIESKGYSPTFREIAEHFGCSPSMVYEQIMYMKERGIVTVEPRINRTIRVIERDIKCDTNAFCKEGKTI